LTISNSLLSSLFLPSLTDQHAGIPMGITAENLAEKYGISREDCDELAIRSQQLWGQAHKNGVFDLEMAPVEIETKKGTKVRTICYKGQEW